MIVKYPSPLLTLGPKLPLVLQKQQNPKADPFGIKPEGVVKSKGIHPSLLFKAFV